MHFMHTFLSAQVSPKSYQVFKKLLVISLLQSITILIIEHVMAVMQDSSQLTHTQTDCA